MLSTIYSNTPPHTKTHGRKSVDTTHTLLMSEAKYSTCKRGGWDRKLWPFVTLAFVPCQGTNSTKSQIVEARGYAIYSNVRFNITASKL